MSSSRGAAAIAAALDRAKAAGRPALGPYFPAGYPCADSTVPLLAAAEAGGADIVELGVPFSDPLADGPSVQRATATSLRNGVTVDSCLRDVAAARAAGTNVPVLLMGYVNPILRHGLARFFADAAAAGADGVIIPDLPPEEAAEASVAARAAGVAFVPMVAPTSTPERLQLAVSQGAGLVYCVSVTGVTGARTEMAADLGAFTARVREATRLPIGVGFGISTAQHVAEVGRVADVAIVGSAIVDRLAGLTTPEAAAALISILRELRGDS